MQDLDAVRKFLDAFAPAYRVRAVKAYRLPLQGTLPVPVIPCLDHEAKLHARVPPHVSAYVEEYATGELHEVGYQPARSLLVVDLVSTHGEHGAESRGRLVDFLGRTFPACRVRLDGLSWIRGDLRTVEASRAQISLKDVLAGLDLDKIGHALERLRAVGSLMEKESRVASWGVRTAATPILAAAGVLLYLFLELVRAPLGEGLTTGLRYTVLGVLGAALLYLGLKAVHLTEMSNRVWKRAAEYGLILAERRRLPRS